MEALGSMAGLAAGGLALFGLAWAFAARARRRRIARGATPARGEAASAGGADFAPVAHRLEARMAAIEDGQAHLAARLDGAGGAEDRLQATAAQLLGLIRDKNATLETALAGLDQLRTRMRTLEQIGDAAEARGLFDRLGERLDALESAQATAAAALDGRLAGLAAQGDVAPIVEKLTALHAQKDAAAEAALGRLGPLEARLAKLEGAAPGEAVARLATRLEALAAAQGATQAALAGLKAEAGPVAELAERLSRLHAQKEALAERLLARLDALEAETAGRDPGPALAALAARIGALEASGSPVAELGEKLAGLHAQKDAALAAVLDRLQPLEARLQAAEAAAVPDPAPALAALAVRLEAAQAARAEAEAGLQGRLAALEAAGSPVAELGERLAELQARKEAAVTAVLDRLQPLETRLQEVAAAAAAPDPALGRLAERVAALEASGSPVAELGDKLAGLHAQKDAALAAVLDRLQPLEAGLQALARDIAAPDPAFDRLAERLAVLEAAGSPVAELGNKLAELHARRDAAVAAVLDRLQPLEARLQEVAAAAAAPDELAERVAALEASGSPVAELGDKLAGLHAQKDAALAAVLDRLQPLEAGLQALARDIAAPDPAFDRLAERLAVLEAAGSPVAELGERLAELQARRDAAVTAVLDRLQPLETRLQEVAAREPAVDRLAERLQELGAALAAAEAGLAARLAAVEQGLGPDRQSEDAARAEAQAIATQLIAMHAAAAQTELFADRLALLEASLPRLSVSQSLMMQALERQAALPEPSAPVAAEAPEPPAAPDPLAAFRDLPRIVSLHQK
jgi:chromosome segregation ATPase